MSLVEVSAEVWKISRLNPCGDLLPDQWSLGCQIFAILMFVQSLPQSLATHLLSAEREQTVTIIDRAISAIYTVMVFNAIPCKTTRAVKYFNNLESAAKKLNLVCDFTSCLAQFLTGMMGMFVQSFWYGAKRFRESKIDPGDVMVVFWGVGVGLSGQKQCLSTARARLRNPTVLILGKGFIIIIFEFYINWLLFYKQMKQLRRWMLLLVYWYSRHSNDGGATKPPSSQPMIYPRLSLVISYTFSKTVESSNKDSDVIQNLFPRKMMVEVNLGRWRKNRIRRGVSYLKKTSLPLMLLWMWKMCWRNMGKKNRTRNNCRA